MTLTQIDCVVIGSMTHVNGDDACETVLDIDDYSLLKIFDGDTWWDVYTVLMLVETKYGFHLSKIFISKS